MNDAPNTIGINISVDPESVIYVTEGILAILRESREEQTIRDALAVLCRATKIDGTTISSCNISFGTAEVEK